MAHLWAKWLCHPCRLGDPHRFGVGGKIRSGPQVGKVAMSPLPCWGSPPLQSGGQNQKWPTCGQSGYVTPAVSEIPTTSERGGKSEVAHLWAKWLRHPCRLGDPHRFRAGGKIRSGPLVGKVAMSPLPFRGSRPLHGGGQIRSGPLVGKVAMSPLPSWGSPPLQSGGEIRSGPQVSKVATSPLPSRGSPPLQSGGEIRSGPQVGKVATSPLPSRGSPPLQSGGQNQKWPTCGQSGYVTPAVSGIPTASERGGGGIRSGPQVGKVATSPLPSRGSPPLQSRGQNQTWPTCGQSGYVTPAVLGIPTAAERGAKSEVAHLWAKWLRHPCRLGDPHRFRAGGEIRSGPLVGKVAMSPLPSRGSPPLQSGGQNQKWPTSGQSGYVTPAVLGIPTAAERGAKSEVAHLWAKWLRHPCRLGDPHRLRARGEIRSGPLVGKVGTSPLPSRGSPPLQSGGQNQKWPTCGQSGYVTPAVSGIPTAAERGGGGISEVAHKWAKWLCHPCRFWDPDRCTAGGKSEVAHLWAKWLCHPCRLGDPHRCRAGGKSEVAHLWAKWLRHPCRLGDPHRFRAGGKSEVAHKWAKWLRHPCRLGDPHRFRAGGKIRSGPLVGKVATSPLPSRGSPPLQSGGGGGIRSGPQVGKVATSPLPSRGSPPLQSRGQNQTWPTCGQSGYVTPAVSEIPNAAERGGKSEVAHLWAKWLRHPCRLGDPHRFRAGGKIRSGPLVGKVATSPLPSRGSPQLQSGGGNQKWPTSGQSGYVTPAVSGIPTASERGAKSEVAHLWAKWLCHPCRLGDPHRFRAGGGAGIRSGPQVGKVATSPLPSRKSPPLQSGGVGIRSGPLVGKVATSPLPSRGSPPLQSRGQNQKWPTCGQSGYVTPAVSGIPTAAERGAKSEVAHKWAKWLRHPCRLGDPHRFRAGGKIRSGPQVGKVAFFY